MALLVALLRSGTSEPKDKQGPLSPSSLLLLLLLETSELNLILVSMTMEGGKSLPQP